MKLKLLKQFILTMMIYKLGDLDKTYLLRTPPKAHGMRTSQSWTSKSFGLIASPPEKSFKLPLPALCFRRAAISIPFGLLIAPLMSLTATTLPPLSKIAFAAQVPTLPNPYKVYHINNQLHIYAVLLNTSAVTLLHGRT